MIPSVDAQLAADSSSRTSEFHNAVRVAGHPVRVCILTETYRPIVGGGEKQAQSLAEDLVRQGLPTTVVTRRTEEALATQEMMNGVSIVRIPPVGRTRAARWLMLVSSFLALARTRREYDVILVSGFKALGVSAVIVGKLFGKACILKADSNGEMSGTFFAAGLKALRLTPGSIPVRAFVWSRNLVLKRADAFIAITTGIENELEQEGVSRSRIRRVTNSVDTLKFCPVARAERDRLRRQFGMQDRDIVVTYTGRLVTYKGLPTLISVIDQIRRIHPHVRVLLVGSGGLDIHNCEEQLRRDVEVRGLRDHVRFAGEVADVQQYLQASDIFVLPSEDDAFPLSLVEAMACGLPVVATRVGGIPEIITPEDDGLLIEAGDARLLHDALCRLIVDRSLSSALGAAAARTVHTRYSQAHITQQYVELFHSALNCVPAVR
jgi:glycosyltransferase involved in cell wall biosynthesis